MARNVGLIIGCDTVENCEFLLENLPKLKYKIAALWTPKLEITVQLAAGFGIPFAANKPDDVVLRKDVEMVVIDCRPSLKCHIVLSALGIGKHAICSAPMSLNLQEANSLLEASKYYPQLLAHVAYSNEFRPALIKMKDYMINNSLGSPLFCDLNIKCPPTYSESGYDWTWDCDAGGGALNQIGSYFIDAMRFLLSAKARHVQGTLCRLNSRKGRNGEYSEHRKSFTSEDTTAFIMRCYPYDNGDANNERPKTSQTLFATVNVVIHCSPFVIVGPSDHSMHYEMNIYGSNGAMKLSNGQFMTCGKNREKIELNFSDESAVDYRCHRTLLVACKHLHDKVLEKTKNSAESNNFANDSYVRSVIDAIRKSNNSGDWVKVE